MKKRTPIEQLLSVVDLHRLFDCLSDGTLIWKYRAGADTGTRIFNAQFPGKAAGSPNNKRYWHVRITVNGVLYLVKNHRIVWAMTTGEWPAADVSIDHRDTDTSNNSFSNLRECGQMGNMKNQRLPKNNTSGFKGVKFHKASGRWMAAIGVDRKRVHLGLYDDPVQAARRYDAAAVERHGEFARTNAMLGLL